MEPTIIFEDEAICVVNKPAGMVVNRAESVKSQTVQEWHWRRLEPSPMGTGEFFEKQGVVHRLDKDTSGVMVLAKTEAAYDGLKGQFMERTTKKTYLALVHGKMEPEEGITSAPVERHPKLRQKFMVGEGGRPAVTEWRVRELFNDGFSLVELRPLTGRTHQIRVHMKHLGHPIVSDPIYGGKQVRVDLTWCPRLFLHAAKIEVRHPQTGQVVEFGADLPETLAAVLRSLDKV